MHHRRTGMVRTVRARMVEPLGAALMHAAPRVTSLRGLRREEGSDVEDDVAEGGRVEPGAELHGHHGRRGGRGRHRVHDDGEVALDEVGFLVVGPLARAEVPVDVEVQLGRGPVAPDHPRRPTHCQHALSGVETKGTTRRRIREKVLDVAAAGPVLDLVQDGLLRALVGQQEGGTRDDKTR